MFYSRGGAIRLCWAAVDQAFRSSSSSSSSGSLHVRVNVNRPRGVTWALLPNICTFQCPRGFCAAAAIELRAPREEAQGTRREKVVSSAVQKWDYSSSSLSPPAWISDRGGHFLFDRGVDLTGRDQCSGQSLLPAANRCRSRRVKTVSTSVAALFSTGGGTTLSCCYSPRCSNNNTTTTMQTRASSTAAATQRREAADAGETDNKGEEQNIKEPSPPAPPSTSSSSPKAPGEPEAEQEPQQDKPNKTQQLQKVFKEYGAVGVSFHITMSLMSLGMFYLLVSSGIDMAAVLCKLGFSEAFVESKMAAGTSTFVLAYAVHKLFAPARISITLVSVPLIVRYLRKTGLFKPPTTTP